MSTPTVSVVIDTYNHERFIEEAVVSVLEQDFPASEMEILVVDDGSTDRTPEILRKFAPRVRVLRKANGGQASAFNAGIPEARGRFISFLDGDDWWVTNKLSRAITTFQTEPDLGFVGHGDFILFPDGRSQLHVPLETVRFSARNPQGARLFRVRKSFLGTCRMTVRAEILRRILPVPETLGIQADEYMFTLAAALCDVRILAEPLFFYRLHDSNAFQMTSSDPKRLNRKRAVMAELAEIFPRRLAELGAEPEAIDEIVESVQLEADQLRLQIDGGWPWETVETEWKLYRMWYVDAPLYHRLFKAAGLAATLLLPPKSFYAVRGALTRSNFYARVRKRLLPIPQQPHIKKVFLNSDNTMS